MLEQIAQAGIALTGAVAVGLSQCGSIRFRRWAPVIGMIGQPFWFAGLTAGQWGMFFACLLYTGAWGFGLWNHWARPMLKLPGKRP